MIHRVLFNASVATMLMYVVFVFFIGFLAMLAAGTGNTITILELFANCILYICRLTCTGYGFSAWSPAIKKTLAYIYTHIYRHDVYNFVGYRWQQSDIELVGELGNIGGYLGI